MTQDELRKLPTADLYTQVLDSLEKMTEVFAELPAWYVRQRPVIGGVFGFSGFSLCSYAHVTNGLDDVMYFVRENGSLFVLGISHDKASALEYARGLLRFGSDFPLAKRMGEYKTRREEELAAREKKKHEENEEYRLSLKQRRSATVKSIPRRRKRIFDESGGKCHYCSTVLTLDGKWHIEHKMPRALGGDDKPGNLVASCVPCNHEKRDTTDQEFIAKRANRSA